MTDHQNETQQREPQDDGVKQASMRESKRANTGNLDETTQIGGGIVDPPPETTDLKIPRSIGRYRIESVLGQGGFGAVYLAYDDQLRRHVTIKVPHRHRIQTPKGIDNFLAEARTLAKLEHPNVVPVHDVGHTADGTCYIVSRYIDGSDLHTRMRSSPLTVGESVEIVSTIAEALHYVHTHGVIHRDIKPSNILVDQRGVPYLADFGLALLEQEAAKSRSVAGTPSYMSPEQARGENHLVDGKSDIFSLGVVLYEMVTGKGLFRGDNAYAVLRLVQEMEVRPVREVNRDIGPELDRICMKAISKRATDRHATALDFADDLRHFLSVDKGAQVVSGLPPTLGESQSAQSAQSARDSRSASRPFLGIVPRGLRSFGPEDAHFFLGLLPGPYGRDGTPESILFWKRRIEEHDLEGSFRVGLIYGPSGCGKSSFVKAGLIPTLSDRITTVFVEAAPDTTETRLLNRLRRRCPHLETKLTLRESIASLRHRQVMGEGKKVLIVIDQFEQWLYSVEQPEHSELANALRQCDGEHVQCILLVRDDFWLAFSRFMDHLEVELLQNSNMMLVDLFDQRHARRVLIEFGRAFGRLPEQSSELTRDQRAFITQAIGDLSESGKVTPVRLALLAEMIKSKPWTASTLRKIGGTAGVGVMFLDENFVTESAPAEYRIHQKAAYATLGELLPLPGANLKGHMKSDEELLHASGYADRPKDFQSLLRALDTELHLITRTDPEGRGDASASMSGSLSGNLSENVYYQLAHDYLVPSIREWQARMQRGTRKGRAEIRMAQRAEVWNSLPESRHLPTWPEWMSIMTLTSRDRWSESEQRMMKAATRRHMTTTLKAAVLALLMLLGIYQFTSWNRAHSLISQLQTASVAEVGGLLNRLDGRERWTVDRLEQLQSENERTSPAHLFSSLALLRSDASHLDSVQQSVLHSDPDTLVLLCNELQPYRSQTVEAMWTILEDESQDDVIDANGRTNNPRFNAAMVLANFDPPQEGDASESRDRWRKHADFVADKLIFFANIDRTYYRSMIALIRPVTPVLTDRLASVMVDPEGTEVNRSASQRLLEDLLHDDPIELTHHLLEADIAQIQSSISRIDKSPETIRPLLDKMIRQRLDLSNPDWKRNAKRKASAAALLLRHGASSDQLWSVFKSDQHQPIPADQSSDDWIRQEVTRLLSGSRDALAQAQETDDPATLRARYESLTFGRTAIPNARTRLVQRIRPFGIDPAMIARRLLVEPDSEIRCGLMHALGEFSPDEINDDLRTRTTDLIKGWFSTAREASVRSNAFWFLRQWAPEWAQEHLYEVSPETEHREWYVNSEHHTMIRLPRHEPDDSYRVEVSMTEVTLRQLLRWMPDGRETNGWRAPELDCAAGNVTYHDAVAYCNWLSRKEGLGEDQLCYPDRSTEPNAPPAIIYPDFKQRTGYRLPFANEWFFMACGGAITDYSFGSGATPGSLAKKERLSDGYSPSRPTDGQEPWAVGLARPNSFGVFDTYMNVREWANDIDPSDPKRFQVCGHDYRYHWGMSGVTPRYVGWSGPTAKSGFYGFRIARSRPAVKADP